MKGLPITFTEFRTPYNHGIKAECILGATQSTDQWVEWSDSEKEHIKVRLTRMIYARIFGERAKEACKIRERLLWGVDIVLPETIRSDIDRLCELASGYPK